MCLSTVYQNEKVETAVLMKNVMRIDCTDTQVTLTDLMDRTITVDGTLETANLVDGFVIIKTN